MRQLLWLGPVLLVAGCLAKDRGGPSSHGDRGESGSASPTTLVTGGDVGSTGCSTVSSIRSPGFAFESDSSLPKSPLELESSYENGVAVVTVRGPQILLDPIARCTETWGTYGYGLHWDDGSQRPASRTDCSLDLRHEFHVGGTFEVRGATSHLGPTDGTIYDSWHAARVVIDPARLEQSERPLRLEITGDERAFRYQTGPELNYTIHKNRPVYLCVELRGETGVIGNTQLIPVRNHVTDGLLPYAYLSLVGPYDEALRAGESEFHARAILLDESMQFLEEAVTEPFRMTQQLSESLHTATFEIDGLDVAMHAPVYAPECFQVDIDWGDGAEHTQRLLSSVPQGCLLDKTVMRFSHTYAAPGTYEVVVRSTEHDPWTPLRDVIGYASYTVKVEAATR